MSEQGAGRAAAVQPSACAELCMSRQVHHTARQPHLLAQVEVAVRHQQAILGARQRGRARGVGRRHVAAAVEVAKVLSHS